MAIEDGLVIIGWTDTETGLKYTVSAPTPLLYRIRPLNRPYASVREINQGGKTQREIFVGGSKNKGGLIARVFMRVD